MANKKTNFRTRRQAGEGSIYQRKRDGRWVGSVTIGYDENGTQKKKSVYSNSRAEVAKKWTELNGMVKSYSYDVLNEKNFEELMQDWLMVFKKSAVTPRTFEDNMRNFRKHIKPIIGKMKVYDIDTFAAQRVFNELMEKGYSTKTIKKNKHLMNQFFEYAVDNNWIMKNPITKTKVKIHDKKIYDKAETYKALSPEVRKILVETLYKDETNFIKPMCLLMMFAGLRIGEACALQWQNVNFKNKTIKVDKSITLIPKFDAAGNVIERVSAVSDTKTTCSKREIPVPDFVMKILEEWKEKQYIRQNVEKSVTADLIAPESYVFAMDNGGFRTYGGCRVTFERFIARNNLKKYHIHFHGLRHTFSNMLFEMNENPKVIQQLLGHRDVKTTIGIYDSVNHAYIRNTTDKLNARINKGQIYSYSDPTQEMIPGYIPDPEPVKEPIKQEPVKESSLTDEDYDLILEKLIRDRQRRKRKEKDFEM